jgi:hypothetical protein
MAFDQVLFSFSLIPCWSSFHRYTYLPILFCPLNCLLVQTYMSYCGPGQALHYYIIGLKAGVTSLTEQLFGSWTLPIVWYHKEDTKFQKLDHFSSWLGSSSGSTALATRPRRAIFPHIFSWGQKHIFRLVTFCLEQQKMGRFQKPSIFFFTGATTLCGSWLLSYYSSIGSEYVHSNFCSVVGLLASWNPQTWNIRAQTLPCP